jgi:hypothetical protein
VYKNDDKKAVLTFLDEEQGQVLEVNFNRQAYDDGEFIDDPDKAAKVDEWCKEHFDTTYDDLTSAVGAKKDIYVYDRFNSLWESSETKKFAVTDKGMVFQTDIKRIVDDGFGIHIYFDYEGEEYESKMMYSDYIENLRKWFVNPQKRNKKLENFKRLFGVDIEDAEKIIGKEILVEVKVAFKKHAYCEIKQPAWN